MWAAHTCAARFFPKNAYMHLQMKKAIFSLSLALGVCTAGLYAQTSVSTAKEQAAKFLASHFAAGVTPPFSFTLDGKASSSFITSWTFAEADIPTAETGTIKKRYTYTDPDTELTAICTATAYTDYNAVDWTLAFHNGGTANSSSISNVRTADITFKSSSAGTFTLNYDRGSTASMNDFAPLSRQFTPSTPIFTMSPVEGRSSSGGYLPFYCLETPDGSGAVVGIGWTGTWISRFSRKDATQLSMASGLKTFSSYLKPGESFRGASVCLLFWTGGDRFSGHNAFRRFMLAHCSRKIDGATAQYPLCTGFDWGSYPSPCNEYTCLTARYAESIIDKNAELDLTPEAFWLDAGWYTGADDAPSGRNWANTVGNWNTDSNRYPNGLRQVADAAHRKGAKFMVWFEPERVASGTRYATSHPEWMLSTGGDQYLFDLSDTAAVEWLSRDIGNFLAENRIDYYRQDCNIDLSGYWRAADARDASRTGITEAHYIEGLYRFWDNLLTRFPRLIIDNCASGGRRLDYETMRRSAPLWRTDYNFGEPDGQQTHTYGLSLYISQHGTGMLGANGLSEYNLRSAMSSALTLNWVEMDGKLNPDTERALRKEYLLVRPYYDEDFYPLSDAADVTSASAWVAYQLHRPADNTGYILAFRRSGSTASTCTVNLRGLDGSTSYELTDYDSKAAAVKTGKELAAGYKLSISSPHSSLLIHYEPSTPGFQRDSLQSLVSSPAYKPEGGTLVQGSNPGCIDDTAAWSRYTRVYDKTAATAADAGLTPADYRSAADSLVSAFAELRSHAVPVTEGFYRIVSAGDGKNICWTAGGADGISAADAATQAGSDSSIWKLTQVDEHTFRIQNVATRKYLSSGLAYLEAAKCGEGDAAACYFTPAAAGEGAFLIFSTTQTEWALSSSSKASSIQAGGDGNSRWKLQAAAYSGAAEFESTQTAIADSLAELIYQSESLMGRAASSLYDSSLPVGKRSRQYLCNNPYTSNSHSSYTGLCDGDFSLMCGEIDDTYFQSQCEGVSVPSNDYHYMRLFATDSIPSRAVMVFSVPAYCDGASFGNYRPKDITLSVSKNGRDWTAVADIRNISNYGEFIIPPYVSPVLEVGKGNRFFKMTVTKTTGENGNPDGGADINGHQGFILTEFNVYPARQLGIESLALQKAVAKAKQVARSAATQKDVDALRAEYFSFLGKYTADEEIHTLVGKTAMYRDAAKQDVYTIDGLLLRRSVRVYDATSGLRKGVYIVGKKKVLVK